MGAGGRYTPGVMTSQERAFHDLAAFAATLKGDKKSETQTFLFHLLEAFGHDPNTLPEGSTFESRVRFSGQRTKFAGMASIRLIISKICSPVCRRENHTDQGVHPGDAGKRRRNWSLRRLELVGGCN